MGLARATVDKYVAVAEDLGLVLGGMALTEEQVLALVRRGHPAGERPTPARAPLATHRERGPVGTSRWLGVEHLRLTRVQELLAQDGVGVKYTTLRRFVAEEGLGRPPRTTVDFVVRVTQFPP